MTSRVCCGGVVTSNWVVKCEDLLYKTHVRFQGLDYTFATPYILALQEICGRSIESIEP